MTRRALTTAPALKVEVQVKTGARASRVLVRDGALRVEVQAAPVDGRANAEVCQLVAHYFDLPPSSVQVAHGQRGKRKVLAVQGIDQTAFSRRLERDILC